MSFKENLDQLDLNSKIARPFGNLKLIWQKQSESFDQFKFENANGSLIKISGDADYLLLFMQVAETIYQNVSSAFGRYIFACDTTGETLLVKPYDREQEDRYAFVALNKALKQLSEEDHPGDIGFYCEVSLEKTSDEKSAKESQKVAKILKGENREDWVALCEQKQDFIKTDIYVLALQKLHSWGFQAILDNGEIGPKQSLVRPIKPLARGAVRAKRSRRN